MSAAAVVVAAGRGERLGAGDGKALVEVSGRSLLELALVTMRSVARIEHVVVVHAPGQAESVREIAGDDAILVPGGVTRSASVRNGVAAVPEPADLVAIHDVARPLVPPAVVVAAFAAVIDDVVAAAPGLPVPDTLKRVDDRGDVQGTVPRDGVWAVHTPQVIRRDVLDATLGWAGDRQTTDDLGLVEQAIAAGVVAGRVRLVRGDPRDLKVTYPEDLLLAAAIVRGSRP